MCGQAGVLFCGEEDQHYLYLVCVVTGWWKAAGTTANVFFSINGESISSDTNHVDIQSCVFSSSIFFINSPNALTEIRLVYNMYLMIELLFNLGTKGVSPKRKLNCGLRPCFQTGYEDWLVFTTEKGLGELTSVSLWHDNTGPSPHWYGVNKHIF